MHPANRIRPIQNLTHLPRVFWLKQSQRTLEGHPISFRAILLSDEAQQEVWILLQALPSCLSAFGCDEAIHTTVTAHV
jgi:hypothetical protein